MQISISRLKDAQHMIQMLEEAMQENQEGQLDDLNTSRVQIESLETKIKDLQSGVSFEQDDKIQDLHKFYFDLLETQRVKAQEELTLAVSKAQQEHSPQVVEPPPEQQQALIH